MEADTGPANSVDIDSGPPAAATFGLTIILDGEEEEVGASLGSTSLHSLGASSLGRGAFDRV